jgi:HK97 family phage major capsid protein
MPVTDPLLLSDVNESLLPRELTGPIFEKSVEQSAVMALARRAPLAIDATTSIPVPLDVPTADWVGQGAAKPLSSGGVDVKQMTPKKIAVLIPVSEEVFMTNAGGLWTQLNKDLPTAFARAFDHAAIHGKTMKGAAGPFPDYLTETTNTVELDTASQTDGGIWADLVNGMAEVVDGDWDYTGTVADNRLKPKLMLATDANGRPIFVDTALPNLNQALAGTLMGEPLAYSRAVSGKHRRQSTSADTGLRAVGGDWSQAAYGVGMDITVRVSKEATYIDEEGGVHSAFQENLVLLLAEAFYGFVMGDAEAFVCYTAAGIGS